MPEIFRQLTKHQTVAAGVLRAVQGRAILVFGVCSQHFMVFSRISTWAAALLLVPAGLLVSVGRIISLLAGLLVWALQQD